MAEAAAAARAPTRVIRFYSRATKFFELSNFHESPFELDGVRWRTVEHYFQAQKFPTSPEMQEYIRAASTPAGAKKLGASRSVPLRADWDAYRDVVMKRALLAKFTQNDELKDLLLSTGNSILEEASPRDQYWGTGAKGTGRNRLGELLMEVRAELKAGARWSGPGTVAASTGRHATSATAMAAE